MCERCAELEEKVAWLEGELGLRTEIESLDALSMALGLPPAVGRVVMRLYRSRGHVVSKAMLWDTLERRSSARSGGKLLDVYISASRHALGGAEAIRTVWGEGYAMTPDALARVSAILEACAAFRSAVRPFVAGGPANPFDPVNPVTLRSPTQPSVAA